MFDDINIDNEKINEHLELDYLEAEKILNDPDKIERLLQKLEKKLKLVPIAGSALCYIPLLISLVRMYAKKEYRDIPVSSITAIIAVLIYWLVPFDILPDFLPFVGHADDAAVITGALILIKSDLDDYIRWRRANGYEAMDIAELDNMSEDTKQKFSIISAFFAGKKFGRRQH